MKMKKRFSQPSEGLELVEQLHLSSNWFANYPTWGLKRVEGAI